MIPLVNAISRSWFAYMSSAAFQATLLALLLLPGINPPALAQNGVRAERTGNPNTASPELSAALQTANSFSRAASRLPEGYRDS